MPGEVYIFSEGSAWVWTGNSTTSALLHYVTDQEVTMVRGSVNYRPPYSVNYTYQETGFVARAVLSQMESDTDLKAYFQGVTPGQLHMHISHRRLGGSAGVRLWSGEAITLTMRGADGQVNSVSLDGRFATASAY